MSRNVPKVLGKTAQLANNSVNQNLFRAFAKLSSNNNYSTKAKKENFITVPKQLHNNNKWLNIFVPAFKNYSSSSVNSNNNTTQVLNPVEYEGWSKEVVCSLLCTPKENGGAGLAIEDVKPLYDAGFKGTSLANIVGDFLKQKEDSYILDECWKSFPHISRDTIKSVVNWVDNLLKTRLYHLWSTEQFGKNLIELVGLSENEAKEFIDERFDGKKACMFFKNVSSAPMIESHKRLFNSLNEIYLNLIEFEKITSYQPFKYINNAQVGVIPLTSDELRLLKEVEGLNLKDLSNAKYGIDRLMFKLHNRKETEEEIIELGAEQYNMSQKEDITKQELTYMIAKGGSGSGKTRILYEVANMLKKAKPTEIFDKTSIIYFNFTNAFRLIHTERDLNMASMISSRICYSAFDKTETIVNSMPKIINDYFLYELFDIISRKLHERLKVDPSIPIPLVIALDEYQNATRFIPDLNTQLQHAIGFYMRKYQKSQGLVVFPIIGGTLLESDAKFEPTNYSSKLVSLPSFRPEDVKAIIEEENVQCFYTPKYRPFWNLVGVVPRHLEWAIEEAKSQIKITAPLETKISNIYMKIVQKVYERFNTADLQDTYRYLTTLTLSGYKYNSESDEYKTKVDQLVSEGKIYKIKNYIGLPPAFIDKFAEDHVDLIPQSFLNDLIFTSNKEEWEKFEEICLKTITCKLNYCFKFMSDVSKQFTTIGSVFNGAHMPTELKKMSLQTLCVANTFFKYTKTDDTMNEIIKHSSISTDIITKSKKNERGIDGFLPVLLSENKKILFVAQNKFLYADSQDRTLAPSDLKTFYENALTTVNGYEVIVIIFTNKRVSKSTANQIEDGRIGKNLIVVSGDCFTQFFHPFIANVLV